MRSYRHGLQQTQQLVTVDVQLQVGEIRLLCAATISLLSLVKQGFEMETRVAHLPCELDV